MLLGVTVYAYWGDHHSLPYNEKLVSNPRSGIMRDLFYSGSDVRCLGQWTSCGGTEQRKEP